MPNGRIAEREEPTPAACHGLSSRLSSEVRLSRRAGVLSVTDCSTEARKDTKRARKLAVEHPAQPMLKPVGVEVEQQAQPPSGQAKVRQQLEAVGGAERFGQQPPAQPGRPG